MSQFYFDYTPGHISARFAHGSEFDYIEFYLRMGGEARTVEERSDDDREGTVREEREEIRDHNLYMSSVFCPFEDFIRFLEAIAIDVQEVAFEWEAEGPTGAMRWTRSRLGESGHLMVEWSGRGRSFVQQTHLYTRDTVAALYGGFRSFVESADYNPFRYEALTLGDCVPLLIPGAAPETLADRLVQLDGIAAMSAISGLVCAADARYRGQTGAYPVEHFLDARTALPADHRLSDEQMRDAETWDAAGEPQRREMLTGEFSYRVRSWHGHNLRSLRSNLIEAFLAKPASTSSP